MIGGGICDEVIQSIDEWVPDNHDRESGFQNELQKYLQERIDEANSSNIRWSWGGLLAENTPYDRSTESAELMLL